MTDAIQGLWIGNRLSTFEQLCIASFLAHGHEFHLYAYKELEGVPKGTTVIDASKIIPEKEIFTYHNGSYAGFADWFRWELLAQRGGYWVDMDIICFKHFDFTDEIVFGIQHANEPAVGVLRLPAGHALASHMIERCLDPHKEFPYDPRRTRIHKWVRRNLRGNRRHDIYWGEAGGPLGFAKALKHFGLMDAGKNYTYFYPVHYSHWKAIFDDTLGNDVNLFSTTYAVHLWNELLRAASFNKDATYPENSLIESLKRRYLAR